MRRIEKNRRRTCYRAGRAGNENFYRLLGAADRQWTIEDLAFNREHLEFSVDTGALKLSLEVARAQDAQPPFFLFDRKLGLRIKMGSGHLTQAERDLAERIFERLSGYSLKDLLHPLQEDGLLFSDPRGPQLPSRMDRYYKLFDHTGDWWKFFYPEQPYLDAQIRLGPNHAKVTHCTLECSGNNPKLFMPSLRYFSNSRYALPSQDRWYQETDITEEDVLAGRTFPKLREILIKLAEQKRPESMHLYTTCLPDLIGDNPQPILREIKKKYGISILWTSKTRESSFDVEAWMRDRLKQVRFAKRRDPRAVICAGVLTRFQRHQAEEMLARLGLKIVGTVYPDAQLTRVKAVGQASALIWVNPVGWERISDQVFLDKLTVVKHFPPFGVRGTTQWLERIRTVLGLDTEPDMSSKITRDAKEALKEIRRDAGSHPVALIGDPADLDLLIKQSGYPGFSVAYLLCELGFPIKCLVYDHQGEESLGRPEEAVSAGSMEFIPFRTRAELNRLLMENIALAFTHFNHDPRLSAHTIPGFSEDVFDIGIGGMINAGRRLLSLAQSRPLNKYRRFMTSWTNNG